MAKTSIHIDPVKSNSEYHNFRGSSPVVSRNDTYENEYHVTTEAGKGNFWSDYIRTDLASQNETWCSSTIAKRRQQIELLYKEKVGQKWQSKTTPIREGVVLLTNRHQLDDVAKVCDAIRKKYGIDAFQIVIHKDEGRWVDRKGTTVITETPNVQPQKAVEWKANLHAHIVFDWQDKETGKTYKLNKTALSDIQTIVADGLGMERGESKQKTRKEHLDAFVFKNKERLKELTSELSKKKAIDFLETTEEGTINKQKTTEAISQLIELNKSLENEILRIRRVALSEREKQLKAAKNASDTNEKLKRLQDQLKTAISQVAKGKKYDEAFEPLFGKKAENLRQKTEVDKKVIEETLRKLTQMKNFYHWDDVAKVLRHTGSVTLTKEENGGISLHHQDTRVLLKPDQITKIEKMIQDNKVGQSMDLKK